MTTTDPRTDDHPAALTPAKRAEWHADAARVMLAKPVPASSTALVYATLAVEARLEHVAELLEALAGLTIAGAALTSARDARPADDPEDEPWPDLGDPDEDD